MANINITNVFNEKTLQPAKWYEVALAICWRWWSSAKFLNEMELPPWMADLNAGLSVAISSKVDGGMSKSFVSLFKTSLKRG